ncbi:hypothetical protein AAE478_002350 [Parahypoxylon ruwenzoriense]
MLPRQQYPAILYAALFGSLAAAQQFPQCITSCVRQSGCSPTNVDCMCEKASDGFLSDVVICMNQWCSTQTTFSDLVGPIQSSCDIPESAIKDAQAKAGFDTGSSPSSTVNSKPEESKTVIASVGVPTKVDGTQVTSLPAPSSTKGSGASSTGSVLLSDTTAVITQTPTASESLLLAATTFTSVPSSAATSSADSSSSESETSQGSTDGSPADANTAQGAATTDRASLLAAVLAVAAAMAFGW